MDSSTLSVFIFATLAFLILPGPAVLYIVARSVDQGWRAGVVSTLGISFGTLGHILAAALGVSAILMQSATAFAVVKYLGAAYLIWLGIAQLREKTPTGVESDLPKRSLRRLFVDGAVVNLLNPKAALFFFAFLPQFVQPDAGSAAGQMVILGLIFLILALLTDTAWAVAADGARRLLKRRPGLLVAQKRVTASVYLGLGVLTAASSD
ncbi:MAG: LysE family translocator [Thermoanaerobaculia bacterium]|nr:LysE family translocator [Thermoanaerobaculia bacterium]